MAYQTTNMGTTDLLILGPLVQPTLTRHLPSVIPSGIRVVRSIELGTPYLNDVYEPLKKDLFDLFVQFRDPVFEIRITLQVQSVNLPKDVR